DGVAGIEGEELGPYPVELAGQDAVVELLHLARLARGGAHRHPGPLGIDGVRVEARVLQRQPSGGDGHLRRAGEIRPIEPAHVRPGLEAAYLRPQMDAEPTGIERLDRGKP